MYILTVLTIFIFLLGFLENYQHRNNIKKIPIRIHVNGTRGKSTTVRLVAASLREAGYRVLAKTTGTAPRIILENGEEEEIKRRGPANIIEQKRFIQKAVRKKVNAVVIECMAVHPETQWVSEHRLIKSTIGIITNIREDHQDVYGPSLEDAARALKSTVPKDSYLITAEKRFFPLLEQQAKKFNTKTILVDPGKVLNKNNNGSENFYFKDNVTIALEVSKLLGIDPKIALRGIAKATPDPGALTIYRLQQDKKCLWIINAFAANDRESILLIWEKIEQLLAKEAQNAIKIALVNHRDDRVTRTIQFDKILSQDIHLDKIILTGATSRLSRKKLIQFGYPAKDILIAKKEKIPSQIIELIFGLIKKTAIVYGLGNTRGMGIELMEYLKEKGERI